MRNIYKNMRLFTSLFALLAMCVFTSCDSDSEVNLTNNWTPKSDFEGVARTSAVAFTIGGKAYVGTGFDGESRLSDFWQYDAEQDSWTRLEDFPGVARSGAVGFSANGKGYIGTGYDGTQNLKDFWEYDPTTGEWTQIADFPGSARYGAVAMSLEDKGYIGAGFDGEYLKDFWQYDPATGAWTAKAAFSGAKRVNGFAFVVNGKGYVGGGFNNGILETDIIEYSPSSDSWRNLRGLASVARGGEPEEDFPAPRANATVFALNNKAYLVGGTRVSQYNPQNGVKEPYQSAPTNFSAQNDVWEFDPVADTWRKLDDFSRIGRESAVGFSIGNFGYVGLGRNGAKRGNDFWQFEVTTSGE